MMMEKISIPDIGEASDVEVIEVLVKPGDHVEKDDSLVVLESDKASMEIPSPLEGTIDSIEVKVGDKVDEGDLILILSTDASPSPGEQDAEVEQDAGVESSAQESTPVDAASSVVGDAENVAEVAAEPVVSLPPKPVVSSEELPETDAAKAKVHAGPSVRKQAREYGVDLGAIKGSGKLGRIVKEDVVAFVKIELTKQLSGGAGIPALPEVDFTKFGEVEAVPLSRIRQASARNLHRSWLNVPHVTQFDQADVTDLELFRKAQNVELADSGLKMTPLVFFIRCGLRAAEVSAI